MKKWFVLLVLLLCLFWISEASARTRMSYSNIFFEKDAQSKLAESWCKEVEKRTHGEVAFRYFPNGTLSHGKYTYDIVIDGRIDIGVMALGYYSTGRFPVEVAINLPMGYTSGSQATAMANAVYKKFKPKEFSQVHILFFHAHGPSFIHLKKSYRWESLDDFKGKKIISTGTNAMVMKALGAFPVLPDLCTSLIDIMRYSGKMLSKGDAQASCHPVEFNKIWEDMVCSGLYMIQNVSTASTTTFCVFMNKNKWNGLTREQQENITEISQEWAIKHGKGWDESYKEGMAVFKKYGGVVIPQSKERAERWRKKAAEPVIDNYIKKVSEKGIDGKAVVNFIKANM